MRTTKFLLAAALALAPLPAFAQAAPAAPATAPLPDADPALFVVRDDDTTIYLFGTFHLLDARPWFNDEVRAAFDASSELVLEAVLPENPLSIQPMMMGYARSDGRRLSTRLSAEQNEALARVLAGMGGRPDAFDNYDPWFVAISLALVAARRIGTNAESGPETVLSTAARARRMPISELEGLEWQFRLFDSLPETQQVEMLAGTLTDNAELPSKLTPMLAAWASGDVERLAALLGEEDDDPSLHRLVFVDRNAAWARWIQDRLARPGTVFVAVGAGHLAGPDSLQAALAALRLNATRVPHIEAP